MENQDQENPNNKSESRTDIKPSNHKINASDRSQIPEGTGIGGSDISGEDSDTRNLLEEAASIPVREIDESIREAATQTDQLGKLREDIE